MQFYALRVWYITLANDEVMVVRARRFLLPAAQ
jgi:hypothetical protein